MSRRIKATLAATLAVLVLLFVWWVFLEGRPRPKVERSVRPRPIGRAVKLTPVTPVSRPLGRDSPPVVRASRVETLIQKIAGGAVEEAMAELLYFFDDLPTPEIQEVGLFLHGRGLWEQAAEIWRKLMEREPDQQLWRRYLTIALIRGGESQEAAEAVMGLFSGATDTQQVVADYQLLSGQWLDSGRPEEAVRLLEQARIQFPENPLLQTELGLAYVENEQVDRAKEIFEKRLAANPNDPDAHFGLGVVARVEGDPDQALSRLNQALQLNPDHPDAKFNMAEILTFERGEKGTVAEKYLAERHYADLIQRYPDDPDLQNGLAAVYLSSGRTTEAIGIWEQVAQALPAESVIHSNLGEAYLKANRPDDAVVASQRALELDPDNSDAYFFLGNANIAKGNREAGLRAIQRAVELSPSDATYQKRLSELGGTAP